MSIRCIFAPFQVQEWFKDPLQHHLQKKKEKKKGKGHFVGGGIFDFKMGGGVEGRKATCSQRHELNIVINARHLSLKHT